MDINTSQLGQNFAAPKAEPVQSKEQVNLSKLDTLQQTAQQTKDFSATAETEMPETDFSDDLIESAVTQINEFVQSSSRQLNFSIDDGSNKQVVKVTDSESGEIIRQIPSEEVLKLSERLKELQTDVGTAVGLLFSKQA
jgi:flagellar protein FlaG